LKAPSVYMMAVWLKNLAGGDDIVVPIPTGSTAAGTTLGGAVPLAKSGNTFVQDLRSAAAASLAFDNRPQPGGSQGPPGGVGGMAPVLYW